MSLLVCSHVSSRGSPFVHFPAMSRLRLCLYLALNMGVGYNCTTETIVINRYSASHSLGVATDGESKKIK